MYDMISWCGWIGKLVCIMPFIDLTMMQAKNLSLTDSWYSNVLTYSRAATMPEAGYYYFMIKNYSSDPVTIEEVELIF